MLILVSAFRGMAPSPFDYIVESCYDGIDNDNDSPQFLPNSIVDELDKECIYMPLAFTGLPNGEYDGQGVGNPSFSDVGIYAADFWNLSTDPNLPTHFEAVKALYEYKGSAICTQELQDSLIFHRDQNGIEDARTGVSQHQSYCGVSY